MRRLTPADVKPHLRLPAGDPGDDLLLAEYIAAAEAHVIGYVRRDLDAEFPGGWPPDILQAVRLLVGSYYDNDSAVGDARQAPLPLGVDRLLARHRDLGA